jgi:hypothetical protein
VFYYKISFVFYKIAKYFCKFFNPRRKQQDPNVNLRVLSFQMIQINQPTRRNSFTSLLLNVYEWLNMSRASLRPSLGAYNRTSNLWFYRRRVAVAALLVVVARTRTTRRLPPLSKGKTRGCQCGCMLLMMGGETPEIC